MDFELPTNTRLLQIAPACKVDEFGVVRWNADDHNTKTFDMHGDAIIFRREQPLRVGMNEIPPNLVLGTSFKRMHPPASRSNTGKASPPNAVIKYLPFGVKKNTTTLGIVKDNKRKQPPPQDRE